LGPRFFGLTPKDREAILEQHYFLIRHLKMSYSEVREMPIMYREWFIKRFAREIEDRNATHKRNVREASSEMDRAGTISRAFSR